ncbi:MAG TPA: alpha/beta hydrolase [Rhizomicrobium sp.]|nr:alpha/beta hydrolase [Rhizomicrobium sp.]
MTGDRPIDQVRQMLAGLIGGPDTPFMERRAQAEQFAAAYAMPEGVRAVADELGGVPVEWIIPDNSKLSPVFFHLHGGGYVLGNPAGSRPLTVELALRNGARVVSVDYRLAPEHPFPAAVDDSLKAYRTLLSRGYSGANIVMGGESAGGGLTIATLLAAREARLALPSAAFAISPWTDLTCTAKSFDSKAAVDPLLTRRSLKEMGDAYLAGGDPTVPTASPHFADLTGLPPLLIHVGSDEVLLDDALALHVRAREAHVPVTLEEWEGMIHVWHMFYPMLPEAGDAIDKIVAFAQKHWR